MTTPLLQHASLPEILTDRLGRSYQLVDYSALSEQELADRAGEFRILLTNGEDVVDRALIESLPALECIADFGVGYDGIDIQAAADHGVAVSNTPGVLTEDVADLAIGLMIATARQIPAANRFVSDGRWNDGAFPWTKKVSGAPIGIVGFGRIGQAIAERAGAFGMPVGYTDRADLGVDGATFFPDILSLARASEFLIVCAPGGATTRRLIDTTVLDAVGPEGILVNISRGTNIDESALVDAVLHGHIGGVALDVFEDEPNVPTELLGRPNVVLTPHMGSATWSTRRKMADLVADNVDAWASSRSLVTPVPLPAPAVS